MDDLIKRLRELSTLHYTVLDAATKDKLSRAADALEAANARIAELDDLKNESDDYVEHYRAELEKANARITELSTKCRLYEASLDKSDREADGLRSALARIKELAGLQNNEAWKGERNTDWSRGRILGIVGDALTKQQEKG